MKLGLFILSFGIFNAYLVVFSPYQAILKQKTFKKKGNRRKNKKMLLILIKVDKGQGVVSEGGGKILSVNIINLAEVDKGGGD